MKQSSARIRRVHLAFASFIFTGIISVVRLYADDAAASAARMLGEPLPVKVGYALRDDFFQATGCRITRVEVANGQLHCEFEGPWTSAPGTDFKTFSRCEFSMTRNGAGNAEWAWICDQFKSMVGKRTTITLSAGSWYSRGGLLMFAYQPGRVDAGTGQAGPPGAQIPFHEAPAPSRIAARWRYSNANTPVE